MSERRPNCMDHWLSEDPLFPETEDHMQKERRRGQLMNEPNKMYILGYNNGIERAAQQCRFYAERTKDCNQSFVTAYDELEQMILMLQMTSFRRQDSPEAVMDKVKDD